MQSRKQNRNLDPGLVAIGLLASLGTTGCPADCEGIGCADLFTATLIGIFPGDSEIQANANPSAESASLLLEGDASRGPQFSLIVSDQALIAGTPYSGEVLLLDSSPADTAMDLEQRVLGRLLPEHDNDAHGASVVVVPDMDGDGTPDLAVGAPDARGGGTNREAGAAYLHLGAANGWNGNADASSARLRILGESARNHLGMEMVGCSDLDADGRGDLAIAAPYSSDGASLGGAVHMVLSSDLPGLEPQVLAGSLNRSWFGTTPGAMTGYALGCIEGLGEPDIHGLAIGAPGTPGPDDAAGAGAIYLIEASPLPDSGQTDAVSSLILKGLQSGEALGHDLDAGDIDGDGLAELIGGAPGRDNGAGRGFLWTGEQLATQATDAATVEFTPQGDKDHLGRAVSLADINGDGHLDVLLGAPRFTEEPGADDEFHGALYLFLGSADIPGRFETLQPVSEADVRWYSPQPFLRTGESFVTGDIDSDGNVDIALLLGAQP